MLVVGRQVDGPLLDAEDAVLAALEPAGREVLDGQVGGDGGALQGRGQHVVGRGGALVHVGAQGEDLALPGRVEDAHAREARELDDEVGALVDEGEGGLLALGAVREGAGGAP